MDNSIEKKYNDAVEEYVSEFKHRYFDNDVYDDSYWIGDNCFDGVLYICDYYFSFNNIKYAIDNSVDEKSLFEWYDHILGYGIGNLRTPPTLKEWWENKDNERKRLEWNLSINTKKIIEFKDNDFVFTNEFPTFDGYYLVIFANNDGIYQKPIKWFNGNWETKDGVITNIIARTKKPLC